MKHTLYYSKYCFFCQKVLMVLRGHQHQIQLASTSESDNRSVLINGGGKGQVPCLRIESAEGDVQWMYESDDILRYVRQQGLLGSS
jgi:glutathione S-transferase